MPKTTITNTFEEHKKASSFRVKGVSMTIVFNMGSLLIGVAVSYAIGAN